MHFLRIALGALCASTLVSACSGFSVQATPVPNVSGAVAAVRTAAAGSNVVVNGGFETDDLSGWTARGTGTGAAKISTTANSGSYATFVGTGSTPEINGYYGLTQSVTIPTGGTLSTYVRGSSCGTTPNADEEADLMNASGTIVKSCFNTLLHSTSYALEIAT